jgi:tetratricopeptide (TPR) repeat protein
MTEKPSAQGTLAKTPFAHLLLYTLTKRLSGTLAIWPEKNDKKKGQDRVLFEEGVVMAMRPVEPADSMMMGLLRLFRKHEAPYGFYEGQNLLGTGDGILLEKLDTYTLVARGLRDHAREDVLDGVLAKIAGKPIRMRSNVPLSRLELNTKEMAFIDQLRARTSTPEELIAGAELSSKDARRLLYLLTLIRGVEAVEGAGFTSMHPPQDSGAFGRRVSVGDSRIGMGESMPPRGIIAGMGSGPHNIGAAFAATRTRPSPPQAPQFAPSMPGGLSRNDEAKWVELSLLYERLDDVNHFELLKVQKEANKDAVSAAYYALVKKFHPDRLPTALEPLTRCAQLVFERLTEAHETLTNATAREEYLKAVAAGGGTRASERMMREVLESAMEYQKAEVLMRRRDYPQAMNLLRSAMNRNPDESDYQALYAWLLHLMNPNEPAPFDDMLRALDRALKANPRNERAHFYKGTILKRMKRDNEAIRHFKQAVDINPRNVDAAREVRIADMRKDSKPPPGQGGILSRLFGGTKPDE